MLRHTRAMHLYQGGMPMPLLSDFLGHANMDTTKINAWQLSMLNDTFKSYYDLKRSQGLNHFGALGHVAHKFVRVLFKLLHDDLPFEPAKLLP